MKKFLFCLTIAMGTFSVPTLCPGLVPTASASNPAMGSFSYTIQESDGSVVKVTGSWWLGTDNRYHGKGTITIYLSNGDIIEIHYHWDQTDGAQADDPTLQYWLNKYPNISQSITLYIDSHIPALP